MIDQNVINNILEKIGALVEMKAKMLAPIDLGFLRATIHHRVEGNRVIIYSDCDYARDLEYGKPPEPLSESEKEDIKEWAERKSKGPWGKVSAKGVIWSLEHKGLKVGTVEHPKFIWGTYRPFMRPALIQSISDIKRLIKSELGG